MCKERDAWPVGAQLAGALKRSFKKVVRLYAGYA
tara:strand:+ start:33 stop:134 length:102 start_codon:yes stop_codon:yes gene_type:complete